MWPNAREVKSLRRGSASLPPAHLSVLTALLGGFSGVCNANYKTSFGCLIELKIGPDLYYMRSKVPDEDTLDIKARELEEMFKCTDLTAQKLFDSIPVFEPTTTSMVEPLNVEKGQFRITDINFYRELPMWDWTEILTLGSSQ